MPIDITFLGHSGFLVSSGEHAVAIDPFLTDNPVAKHTPAEIKCTTIALTHAHADHFGDTVAIAQANKATVFASFEITEYCGTQGVERVEPMNPGGKVETDFGYIALTQAFHSSSYADRCMGVTCGVMLNIGGVTLYHCGDTCLFSDMQLLGEIYRPQIAMIPIGDRFTMGPELATRAAEFIRPKVMIPIHYNTWPPIEQDPSTLTPSGVEVKAMQPGESFSYG